MVDMPMVKQQIKVMVALKHEFGCLKRSLSHYQDELQKFKSVSLSLKVIALTPFQWSFLYANGIW